MCLDRVAEVERFDGIFWEVDWIQVIAADGEPLPETNIFAPENRPKPNRKGSYFQPSIFRGKLLVSGRVVGGQNH